MTAEGVARRAIEDAEPCPLCGFAAAECCRIFVRDDFVNVYCLRVATGALVPLKAYLEMVVAGEAPSLEVFLKVYGAGGVVTRMIRRTPC